MTIDETTDPRFVEVCNILLRTWPERLKLAYIAASDFDFENTRNLAGLKAICSEWLDDPRDIDAILASFGFVAKFGERGQYVHIFEFLCPADGLAGELSDDRNIQAGFVLARYRYDIDGEIPNLALPLPPSYTEWKQRAREIVARLREAARMTVDQFITELRRP